MGYDTDFYGAFLIEPPLAEPHWTYLCRFTGTRRMKLNAEKAAAVSDPVREAVGLPVGPDGAYYVANQNDHYIGGRRLIDRTEQEIVVDSNEPPEGQPRLWCDWGPSFDRRRLEWNGSEKTYESAKWLQYLITHFLGPWGYSVSGAVFWNGEQPGDQGVIEIRNNQVEERVDESLGVYFSGFKKLTPHTPSDENEEYVLERDIGDGARNIIRVGAHPKYREVASDLQHLGFYVYEGEPVELHLSLSEFSRWVYWLEKYSRTVKPDPKEAISGNLFQELLRFPQSGSGYVGFQATSKLAADFAKFQPGFKELIATDPRIDQGLSEIHEKVARIFQMAAPAGCVAVGFNHTSRGFYAPHNKIGGYEPEDSDPPAPPPNWGLGATAEIEPPAPEDNEAETIEMEIQTPDWDDDEIPF